MSWIGRAAAVATASVAAACSLGSSLSGLSGGGGGGDAGAAPPANASDAGLAPTSDAAAKGTSFCDLRSTAPLLCADFDQGPYDLGWKTTTLTAGGTLDRDPLAGVLRATTPAAAQAGVTTAYLSYVVSKTIKHVHAEARLRATALSGGQLTPFALTQNDSGYRSFILYVEPGKATIQEETADPQLVYQQHALASGTTLGQWQQYAIDFTFGGSAVAASVSVDGKSVLELSNLAYAWVARSIEVQVGVLYTITKDAAAYEIDNVVVDAD
jgi:hypothetical protein